MRSLDLQDFLDLIQSDIKELDELRRQRRREERGTPATPGKPKSGRKASRAEDEIAAAAEEDLLPAFSLHIVECCGKRLGSFPAPARIRCPFCESWHEAGDFPTAPPT